MADDLTKNKVILDYTSRDFDAIRSMLVGIAQGKFPDWSTVGQASDFGTLLLELYAYMGDVSNYYIDRVGAEAFLGTAQRRQSVYYMADMLGYKPIGQRAATVLLTFKLDSGYGEPVVLPSGTLVTNNGDDQTDATYFETDYEVTVAAGGVTLVTATEGRSFTEGLPVSAGQPNATFILSKKGIIFNTVSLTTTEGGVNIPWVELDSVANARPTQSAYSTYLDDDGYTHIVMGDNSAGRVPPIGAEISVSYRYGVGASAGNIGAGSITNIVTNSAWSGYLSVNNAAPPQGGADPESLESMRFSIPRANRLRSRAVTLDDHAVLALQVPGVGKATAYGSVYSAVTVRIAPTGGFAASETGSGKESTDLVKLRNTVLNYLSDKVLIGSTVFVERPEWHDVELELELAVLDGYVQSDVTTGVTSAIYDLFSFDKLDFGQKVTRGAVYRATSKVNGVDYIEIIKMRPTNPSSYENPRLKVQNIVPAPKKIAQLMRSRRPEDNGTVTGLKITATGGL